MIKPQKGFQHDFVMCRADILIAGAAAGVGKTFSLLLDPVRHVEKEGWGAVIFRRTMPQIKNEGGLWDASMKIYPNVDGVPKESSAEWNFPNGNKFKFSHLEYEKNVIDWQGSEIPYIGFDELTHFSKKMFFYLLSRNRSTCGVKPRVRATCNPDPDSWVAEFISWWIGEDGFPIEERCGVLRYLLIDGDNYIWGDTKEEGIEKGSYLLDPILEASNGSINPRDLIKSVTFIPGSIYGNKELLSKNPEYLSNLLAQDEDTKASLLDGNWKVRTDGDEIINAEALVDSFGRIGLEGKNVLSADIAMEGSDKFVLGYMDGYTLKDIEIIDKSDGKEVVDGLRKFRDKHGIRDRHIVYDDDGIGSFVGGFFRQSNRFKNGGKPLNDENYKNLKTQCYYKIGEIINSDQFGISEHVLSKRYDAKMTIRERLLFERKAIRKLRKDDDGKIQMITKKEMRTILNGGSPDLWDMIMMTVFVLINKQIRTPRNYTGIAI